MIFAAGLIFGWGPILPLVAAIGIAALLVTTLRKRSLLQLSMLTLSLLSVGSFLVVAFVFSDDSNYLTYQHISTLIRFSNTAIPAYFIAAPVAFDILLRKRRYILPVIAMMLFTLAAIPTYQAYASSNLNLGQNPFSLDYRTPGVIIRDYVTKVSDGAPLIIMGYSQNNWWWTPGTTGISNVSFYPYLAYESLVSYKWPSFYVFGDGDGQMYCELHAVIPLGTSLGQYQVVREQSVLNQSGYSLVKVDLRWLAS